MRSPDLLLIPSSSCCHLGQPTEVPTLAHAQVRGLLTSAGLSSALPLWPGTLPSAFTAVPILSAQCGDRTGPNLPLPGSLTSDLLPPIQSHRAFSLGLQIRHSLSGQDTCHLRHETNSPLPGSLRGTAFQTLWAAASLALSALPMTLWPAKLKSLERHGQHDILSLILPLVFGFPWGHGPFFSDFPGRTSSSHSFL